MIEAALVCKLLSYDADTGGLTWLERGPEQSGKNGGWKSFNKRFAGKAAFTSINGDGYYHGNIFNRNYQAHRVIWAIVNGEWPKDQIDHINGNRADNRIVNLRTASNKENQQNAVRQINNTSGHNGVVWNKRLGKWQAQIQVGGRKIYLGVYSAIGAAIDARTAADRLHGFHENHGRHSHD